MMFKGTDKIVAGEFSRVIARAGGRDNAFTNRDYTAYYQQLHKSKLELALELEADRMRNLTLSGEEFDKEIRVVMEERRLRTEDQPGGRAQEALFSLAFRAHPYRWPVIGWRSDVEAASVEACREFFRTYYAPNNIAIAIVGDFDTGDALARVRRAFGPLDPAPEIPRNPQREPEPDGERRQTVLFDLRGPIFSAAWHAPPTGHADGDALDVASQVLSGGRSSRLYQSLVYGEQQALTAYGAYFELQTAGLFYAFASVRPDAAIDRVEELLTAEIDRLREEPISEAELEKAKRQLEVALVEGLVTNEQLAGRIAFDSISFGRIRPLEERLERLRAVSADDVQRVARAYLGDERRSVVRVVAPPASDAPE
jgi:zinc protease